MTEGKVAESKRRSAWGRYLLLLFVAAWMFVLGLLVGRGTAPVHFDTDALQRELVALRDAMVQKERQTLEKTLHGEEEQTPLEFYEKLKKDDPDTTVEMPPSPSPAVGATAPETAASMERPPHKTRAAVIAKPKDARVTPPAAAPPKPTSAPDTGTLTIQVAALKDGDAAERIVATLKADGYPAYLSRQVVAGKGLWFRVRVGSYQDRAQAAADMTRMARDGRHPMLVPR